MKAMKMKVPYLTIKQEKKGSFKMEDTTVTKTQSTEPDYTMRDLDQGTIQILIEDKIATGG